MSKEESTLYSFKGDNAKLVGSIKSLLALDSKGALVPNGVCGLARQLLESAIERLSSDAQPVAWLTSDGRQLVFEGVLDQSQYIEQGMKPLFTRSDAGEVDRLNTIIEQQKSLIASLRAELRESYSIDGSATLKSTEPDTTQ